MLTIKVPLLGAMVEVDYLYHPPVEETPASYASGGEPGEGHWAEVLDVRLNGISIELDDMFLRDGPPKGFSYINALDYLTEYVAEAHVLNDGW